MRRLRQADAIVSAGMEQGRRLRAARVAKRQNIIVPHTPAVESTGTGPRRGMKGIGEKPPHVGSRHRLATRAPMENPTTGNDRLRHARGACHPRGRQRYVSAILKK